MISRITRWFLTKRGMDINGCRVVNAPIRTRDFYFASHVIYLNNRNQIGVEFDRDSWIRIDGVITTDEDSFKKMMDSLVELSIKVGYDRLYFADDLEDDVLHLFLNYGFKEVKVLSDPYNHYLDMYISEVKREK